MDAGAAYIFTGPLKPDPLILYIYHEKYTNSINDLINIRETQGYITDTYLVQPNDTNLTIKNMIKCKYNANNLLSMLRLE